MTMPDLVGSLFGKYVIHRLAGCGGMADVYLGYRKDLDRTAALKIIHPNLTQDSGFVARFQQEARTLANLDHAHIVRLYDLLQQEDLYCIVMEFIQGETLAKRLSALRDENHIMPLPTTVQIIKALCSALGYAHSKNMVHRDIKPSNVMFKPTADGEIPVLTDFGIAKIIKAPSLTNTNVIIGTPRYMSPEQARGVELDSRSDIYSLGVVLYELATGRVPFEGDSGVTIALKHMTEPLPPPRQFNPELPESIEGIIAKAMEKSPAKRFQTTAEMANALLAATAEWQREGHEERIGAETLVEVGSLTHVSSDPANHENEDQANGISVVVFRPDRKRSQKLSLPHNQPLRNFLSLIVKELQCSEVTPTKQPIHYVLHRLEGEQQAPGSVLLPGMTLEQLGISNGDALWLRAPELETPPTAYLEAASGERFNIIHHNATLGRGRAHAVGDIDLTSLDVNATVSRQHAQILQREEGYYVRDLNSTNGVVVDGVALPSGGRIRLKGGETIKLGDVKLVFHLPV